jgi:hypothetical protein
MTDAEAEIRAEFAKLRELEDRRAALRALAEEVAGEPPWDWVQDGPDE